jgi:hypothetical protein
VRREVPFPRTQESLAAKGIEARDWPDLWDHELMRALLPEHRLDLLATEAELRRRIPRKLPFFLRLDAWHHPDVAVEEPPSQSPTFQALAEAMVKGDPNRFTLTKPPNTHWSNWENK